MCPAKGAIHEFDAWCTSDDYGIDSVDDVDGSYYIIDEDSGSGSDSRDSSGRKWNFDTDVVNSDMTLYARWIAADNGMDNSADNDTASGNSAGKNFVDETYYHMSRTINGHSVSINYPKEVIGAGVKHLQIGRGSDTGKKKYDVKQWRK